MVNEMANTRKGCKGTPVLRNVKASFWEYVEDLAARTEADGSRQCRVCGEECECLSAGHNYTGLNLVWRCERGHKFQQDVSYSQLQQRYMKANPTKRVSEGEIHLSKHRKSDLPKKWRKIV